MPSKLETAVHSVTNFEREFPLYLNFGDYERRWLVPHDSQQRSRFDSQPDPVTKAELLIEPWRQADAAGHCAPQILEIVNSVFRDKYVREDTPNVELHRLFKAVRMAGLR